MRVLAIVVGLGMLAMAAATAAPTAYPTSAPTMAPTAPIGRCCGVNATTNAPFCKITSAEECGVEEPARRSAFIQARRDLGGDTWDPQETCSSSCTPLGGSTANGGVANLTVNISTAGFAADEGIELGPKGANTLPAAPAGTIILAFSLTHFKGLDVLPGGQLAAGKYILVDVQSSDPLFSADQAIVVWRLDEVSGELVLASEDCDDTVPANVFTAVPANGGVPSWTVAICHLSDFGVSLASADDADDKDDKPVKTTKGKKGKAVKPSKASKTPVPKVDPKKPSKAAKDTKAKAKDAKDGKDKKTKIAVGAGVGAGVVAMAALGGVVAWRKRNAKAEKKPQPQRELVATVSV